MFQVKPMMEKDFSKIVGRLWNCASKDTKDAFSEYAAAQNLLPDAQRTRSQRKRKVASRGVQKTRVYNARKSAENPYPDHTPWHFPPVERALPFSPDLASTASSALSSPGSSTWAPTTPASSVASIEDEPFKRAEFEKMAYENMMMAALRQGANAFTALQDGLSGHASGIAGIGNAGFQLHDSAQYTVARNPSRTQPTLLNAHRPASMPQQWYSPQQVQQATMVAQPTQLPRWNEDCAPLDAGFFDFATVVTGSSTSFNAQPQVVSAQAAYTYHPTAFTPAVPATAHAYGMPTPTVAHQSFAVTGPPQIPMSVDSMPLASQPTLAYDAQLDQSTYFAPVPYVPRASPAQAYTDGLDWGIGGDDSGAHSGDVSMFSGIEESSLDGPYDIQEVSAEAADPEWLQDMLFDGSVARVAPQAWSDLPSAS
ncbi:hypothetical protein PYCCODRAFT_1481048 [Trametes coccinea BRFM310]|uniref:Uncharacterized protein n=1 Tax=Trametes coccinea (strain BRFM310) TaxID=1353009 RepID=A0A1Y2ICZ8_TRAC3|nr:hypothetical protein PYCCODRAFT_1481048 [Trametes coccinea BRFM310]